MTSIPEAGRRERMDWTVKWDEKAMNVTYTQVYEGESGGSFTVQFSTSVWQQMQAVIKAGKYAAARARADGGTAFRCCAFAAVDRASAAARAVTEPDTDARARLAAVPVSSSSAVAVLRDLVSSSSAASSSSSATAAAAAAGASAAAAAYSSSSAAAAAAAAADDATYAAVDASVAADTDACVAGVIASIVAAEAADAAPAISA